MDTTFGLCFAATYVLFASRVTSAPEPRPRSYALFGALGGLSLAVRPEFATLAALVPTSIVIFAKSPAQRRAGLAALGATFGVLAAHLAFCKLYFGSALPLPFWAKGTDLYGAGIARAYRGGTTHDLLTWLGFFWPLFVPIVVDIGASPRAFLRETPAIEKGILAAALFLMGYSWLVVTPIMGHSQRFFYPPLPLLVYLSAASVGRLLKLASERGSGKASGVALAGALVYGLSMLAPPFAQAGKDLTNAMTGGVFARFDMRKHSLEQGPQRYWFGLDRFSALPDDAVIATTEVGMLSALNLKKTVIDLAGLNEPKFALSKFSADTLFTAWKPDLIYMPYPHYTAMIEEIQRHPAFADYEVYSKAQLQTLEFGIAIKKGSKYYPQMDAVVRDKRIKK